MTLMPILPAGAWRRIGPTLFVLAGMAGTAAALAATAVFIGGHCETLLPRSRAPTGEEAMAAIPIEYALNSRDDNDVIFFGDSAPLYAIDPVYFEERTGLKAYNLGSFRHLGINGFLVTAQAYCLRHPPPRVIVLCVSPEVPGGADTERPFASQFVRTYGRQLKGAHPAVQSIVQSVVNADGYERLVKRGASLVRDYAAGIFWWGRRDLRAEMLQGSSVDTFYTMQSRLHAQRGYAKPRALHGPPNSPDYAGVRWTIRPEWDRAVRALVGMADAAGSRLMIRLAPARTDAAVENFEEISRGLRRLHEEFPQVIVDPVVRYYEPALCYDLWHLNAEGAKKFTGFLAHDILTLTGSASIDARNVAGEKRAP